MSEAKQTVIPEIHNLVEIPEFKTEAEEAVGEPKMRITMFSKLEAIIKVLPIVKTKNDKS